MLDYAMRLAQHRQGRRAAHVHLSRLAPANRREHDIHIAMSTLEPLLRKFGGSMFRLSSDDLIVALKDASAANIGDYLGKPEFLKFDALMSQNKQLTMLFEVQSMDIFGDKRAHLFARNFLRERSYGVALDGLTHLTFPLIDCKKLKLDFQKIIWQPGMAAEIRADLINSIKRSGANRVILCCCDDQDAINFGIEAGIALFQGRHLDSMLAAG